MTTLEALDIADRHARLARESWADGDGLEAVQVHVAISQAHSQLALAYFAEAGA